MIFGSVLGGLRQQIDHAARLLMFAEGHQSAEGDAERARVFRIGVDDRLYESERAFRVAGLKQAVGLRDRLGIVADRPDEPFDEGDDLALRNRADEAVDRLALLEGDDRRDRLDAELLGDLRMIVDVHLDEADLALGRRDRFFNDRRELLARTAPRRPEIDDDGRLERGGDDIRAECRRGRLHGRRGIVLQRHRRHRASLRAPNPRRQGRRRAPSAART